MERELTEGALLCTPCGRLDPGARGWSRRPLLRGNLRGHRLRKKRWDYWAVTTDRHLLFLLLADADYVGVAVVSLLDLASGERFEAATVTPFGLGVRLPETTDGAPVRFDHLGIRVALAPFASGIALQASARSLGGSRVEVDLSVERPPGHDTLNVVVPFPGPEGERFQLTSKQIGLPATGTVTWNGTPIDFSRASASLDHGRGVWPWRTGWHWAAASGTSGGRQVALNLGGRWTDGSGATENGLWIDGRLHKLGDRLDFTREATGWRIRTPESDRAALRFSPLQKRELGLELGLLAARLDWSVGRFHGTLAGDDGTCASFDGVLGWCEQLDARW
jgi:hypothetical protein